ncbi:hypothetical protein L1887_63076 [Cichorium endivia]|nr:hypothetical protein L1887_63076 [Cichorium endivia]
MHEPHLFWHATHRPPCQHAVHWPAAPGRPPARFTARGQYDQPSNARRRVPDAAAAATRAVPFAAPPHTQRLVVGGASHGPAQDGEADAPTPVDPTSLAIEKGYNPAPGTFDLAPANARFFVIKSYTEEDVHKSLKYEIWASTDKGNQRPRQGVQRERKQRTHLSLLFGQRVWPFLRHGADAHAARLRHLEQRVGAGRQVEGHVQGTCWHSAQASYGQPSDQHGGFAAAQQSQAGRLACARVRSALPHKPRRSIRSTQCRLAQRSVSPCARLGYSAAHPERLWARSGAGHATKAQPDPRYGPKARCGLAGGRAKERHRDRELCRPRSLGAVAFEFHTHAMFNIISTSLAVFLAKG